MHVYVFCLLLVHVCGHSCLLVCTCTCIYGTCTYLTGACSKPVTKWMAPSRKKQKIRVRMWSPLMYFWCVDCLKSPPRLVPANYVEIISSVNGSGRRSSGEPQPNQTTPPRQDLLHDEENLLNDWLYSIVCRWCCTCVCLHDQECDCHSDHYKWHDVGDSTCSPTISFPCLPFGEVCGLLPTPIRKVWKTMSCRYYYYVLNREVYRYSGLGVLVEEWDHVDLGEDTMRICIIISPILVYLHVCSYSLPVLLCHPVFRWSDTSWVRLHGKHKHLYQARKTGHTCTCIPLHTSNK